LISSFAAICIIMNIEILKKFIKYGKTFWKKMYSLRRKYFCF
jgi:hypothetical protein